MERSAGEEVRRHSIIWESSKFALEWIWSRFLVLSPAALYGQVECPLATRVLPYSIPLSDAMLHDLTNTVVGV